jgi:hypothetical protein
MYSTCIYCNGSLGRNESLDHFPVGRRLAYDGATGRLWVICSSCTRWNLSPLETRWEAIEDAERLFRSSKLRVATDNIGMARLRDGTELVRIGRPPDIELATWRYGKALLNRYRRQMISAAPAATLTVVSFGSLFGSMAFAEEAFRTVLAANLAIHSSYFGKTVFDIWKGQRKLSVTVFDHAGRPLPLSQASAGAAALIPTGRRFDWSLQIKRNNRISSGPLARMFGVREEVSETGDTVSLTGDVALRALSTLLPRVNNTGADQETLSGALDLLNDAPNQQYLLHLASTSQVDSAVDYRRVRKQTPRGYEYSKLEPYTVDGVARLDTLPSHIAYALEMSLHAESERRAMEGELAELEQQWKDAEAIGKIADDMFTKP